MTFIPSLIAFLESSKYFLIFAGTYIEGTTVMMATGMLWHLGTADFWPAYGALILGDILSDIMWYFVGYHGARWFFDRWGHWFGITPPIIAKVGRRFGIYHTKVLLMSKLSMGFGMFAIPILTVAGMLRVPFSRYVAINLFGSTIWVLFVMLVGYYFGNLLDFIPRDFQIALAIASPMLFFYILRIGARKLEKVDW